MQGLAQLGRGNCPRYGVPRKMKTSTQAIDDTGLGSSLLGTIVQLGESSYWLKIASVIDDRNTSPWPVDVDRRPYQITYRPLNARVVSTRVRARAFEEYAVGTDTGASVLIG